LSSAVGYRQWAAARRLVKRGAKTLLWHEAALGLMPAITKRVGIVDPLGDCVPSRLLTSFCSRKPWDEQAE
jgi:hypothetical protein